MVKLTPRSGQAHEERTYVMDASLDMRTSQRLLDESHASWAGIKANNSAGSQGFSHAEKGIQRLGGTRHLSAAGSSNLTVAATDYIDTHIGPAMLAKHTAGKLSTYVWGTDEVSRIRAVVHPATLVSGESGGPCKYLSFRENHHMISHAQPDLDVTETGGITLALVMRYTAGQDMRGEDYVLRIIHEHPNGCECCPALLLQRRHQSVLVSLKEPAVA